MENKLKILLGCGIILAFLTGFLVNFAVKEVYIDKESPFLIGFSGAREQPSNWITERDIEILSDKIIIHVENAMLSRYASTGSMLPTLGENTTGVKIIPKSAEDIHIGDIITFQQGDTLIAHRVVGKGEDEQGSYFITKGDNNQETDGKVYFESVKYVTIALIY
jgi:ribosomal protein L27